jgi:membrane protein implicated in regulation of membrane protease activity
VQAWVIWLIVAMALGIAELLSLTLNLALLAAAAIVATLTAAIGLPWGFQVAAFAISAVLLVVFVRPVAMKQLQKPPVMRSGTAALVGREALAVTEVTKSAGLVKIGGEEWTARPYDSSLVIPAGATVDVLAIEGATALVHPREDPWAIS